MAQKAQDVKNGCLGLAILGGIAAVSLSMCSSDIPEKKRVNDGFYMIRIAGDTPAADVLKSVREMCADEASCLVMGWTGDAVLPGRVPLLDREADSLAFRFNLNRATGWEMASWNCAVFKDAPKLKTVRVGCLSR